MLAKKNKQSVFLYRRSNPIFTIANKMLQEKI